MIYVISWLMKLGYKKYKLVARETGKARALGPKFTAGRLHQVTQFILHSKLGECNLILNLHFRN